ncbi:hypothetical protein JD844_015235 [Phrynosoma platyrhinos]|uniref:WSC domain-containing protein n=1 Tax=Phrynosoma platyrhinos TaxID=52577 RepID=A0ABQ7T8R4_PHRPL|nr:hypothetical protein JD844_015235 [Phrynosoma platyrhinos]
MAKLLLKFQRYFRRKPIRFFMLIALYLTAGSLVFLHASFTGQTRVPENDPSPNDRVGLGTDVQHLGTVPLARELKETPDTLTTARRYGSWFKSPSKDLPGRNKVGDYGGTWSRALKGRNIREKEEDRGKAELSPGTGGLVLVDQGFPRNPFSAVFPVTLLGSKRDTKYIGCYMDNTHRRALRGVSFFDYKKMTLFRCQDNCAERGYLYAGLEFGAECYCGHKIQAANVSNSECNMECKGEKSNICGGVNRLSIYRLELAQESARRYGSAIFRGCFRRPENASLALPASRVMKNMSVDRCVDFCTEKYVEPSNCPQSGSIPFFLRFSNSCFMFPFPSRRLSGKGFKGERDHWRSGRTICIKTHESGQKEIEAFDAAILLIRNPYKALMAEFNRKYGGHIGFASHAHWKGKGDEKGIRNQTGQDPVWNCEKPPVSRENYAPWWATHTLDWLKYGKRVLVVHFEDLKHDLFIQLKRMVSLLGITVLEDRLLCVEGQKDGNFKRSGLRKLEYDPYTPEMRKMINSYIKTVDTALKLRNLTGVPEDYYPR